MRKIPGEKRSISRESRGFPLRQRLADALHRPFGVVAARTLPPLVQLMGQIRGRLPGEGWVGCADAFAARTMTGRARGKPACAIATVIESARGHGTADRLGRRPIGHGGIIAGDGVLLRRGQLARDPFHLGMAPPTARIGFELGRHIAAIETGEPRRASTVAASVDPVTGDTGIACTGVATADRQQLAAASEPVRRTPLDRAAPAKGDGDQ